MPKYDLCITSESSDPETEFDALVQELINTVKDAGMGEVKCKGVDPRDRTLVLGAQIRPEYSKHFEEAMVPLLARPSNVSGKATNKLRVFCAKI